MPTRRVAINRGQGICGSVAAGSSLRRGGPLVQTWVRALIAAPELENGATELWEVKGIVSFSPTAQAPGSSQASDAGSRALGPPTGRWVAAGSEWEKP